MCCMKESRLRLMNARGNVHPCIYESPHSSTFGFWLIFFPLLQPIQRIPAPDKEPHCLFYYKENPSMCEPRRTCDWLALSPCDYLHFIQSGRCTGTKSSAGYSPSSLSLSLSLSSSSNIPHTVSAHLYWRIIFCGINFNSPFNVRFHLRTQFSG